MGCDIHFHTEIKIDDEWHHYSTPNVQRNYALFEVMAGVRGDAEKTISLPKGLPDDLSAVTAIAAADWEPDGHSHSWLDFEEIKKLRVYSIANQLIGKDDWQPCFGYYREELWEDFIPETIKGRQVQDVRFVFWFDN